MLTRKERRAPSSAAAARTTFSCCRCIKAGKLNLDDAGDHCVQAGADQRLDTKDMLNSKNIRGVIRYTGRRPLAEDQPDPNDQSPALIASRCVAVRPSPTGRAGWR